MGDRHGVAFDLAHQQIHRGDGLGHVAWVQWQRRQVRCMVLQPVLPVWLYRIIGTAASGEADDHRQARCAVCDGSQMLPSQRAVHAGAAIDQDDGTFGTG
ncbi:hypothetical protein G6F64_015177 [Rhizopus arrhizus]|uniref:Uncharacterized protein n=1 Tax=Rhizopus oryzae TaxID=64495 RepID=A0A9P6WS12_RHIOR|nr:hypothetical protein G6F64_015177 [Rhizopus arrhizus]